MPTRITEFHGAPPLSPRSAAYAKNRRCPFVEAPCKKRKSERGSGGACSLKQPGNDPVIICPNRLYDGNFEIIRRIARECFGENAELITKLHADKRRRDGTLTGNEVITFGQGFGGELGIAGPRSEEDEAATFKIDYLLLHVGPGLEPRGIAAVEVQTIDTTYSYRPVSQKYYAWDGASGFPDEDHVSKAGFNWENVTKRILPQIIYKGHALRRDRLATHGLFFVLPSQVLAKIQTRIGHKLLEYPKGPGTVTFKPYELIAKLDGSGGFELKEGEGLTTSVEQIAFAFVSPRNLPDPGVYEARTREDLNKVQNKLLRTLERDIAKLEAEPLPQTDDDDERGEEEENAPE